MTGLILPEVNGEFYINNINAEFFLREDAVWNYKGRFFRANIVGLYAEGRFTGLDVFELARSATSVHYSPGFSPAYSKVTAAYPPAAGVTVVFTDDLATYLAYGERAICTATFAANTNVATLTFLDATVAADAPVWVVLPEVADIALAGLRVLVGGDPH
jgi:hypothetical protein